MVSGGIDCVQMCCRRVLECLSLERGSQTHE